MSQEKRTYYIHVGSGEISQSSTASSWNYKIEATDEEITQLRAYFDENYLTEWKNFFRAHVPYVQYHHDPENDAYDETMVKVYEMIYNLGDHETKNHIELMGILKSD